MIHRNLKFERGHPVVYYQICITYYTPSIHHIHQTYILTPWCRVVLEKLTGLQLVKKFPTFHGTRRFITALTSVRHLSLSWASPFQSIYPHPTSWRSVLILSSHLHLGLPSGLFPNKQDAIITIRWYLATCAYLLWYDARITLCCWYMQNTISLWTIVRPEYSARRFSFTTLLYYSTVLILSKNFHILSKFNVNEMGSHWVISLLYLNCCS